PRRGRQRLGLVADGHRKPGEAARPAGGAPGPGARQRAAGPPRPGEAAAGRRRVRPQVDEVEAARQRRRPGPLVQAARRGKPLMKMFFATDIHGSEICWRKFLNAAAFYKADLVVLGGDVTGKIMVPIVAYPGYWEVTIRGERRRIDSREELLKVEQQLRDRGSYPAIVTREELAQLSTQDAIDQR